MTSAEIGGAPQWQAMLQASWHQCCCSLPQLCRTHEQQRSSDVSSNVNGPSPTTSNLSSKQCLIVVAIIPTIIYTGMCILNGFLVLNTSQPVSSFLNQRATCDPLSCIPMLTVVLCCEWLQQLSFKTCLILSTPTATLQPGNITWHAFGLTHWGTPQKSCHFAVRRPVPVAQHLCLWQPCWRTSLMRDHLYFQPIFQNLPFILLCKMNPLVIF